MRAALLCALLALVLAVPPVAGSGLREVGRFEGIWKKCYEPGLDGVSEIDSGFLVLMPDSKYYEVSSSCCAGFGDPRQPHWFLGTYTVESDLVTLSAKRIDGSSYEIPLQYRAPAKAVFFDAPGAPAVEVEALSVGENLNYAWCRVYPGLKQ
jgi:hypothetical protein